jgi:hypothetical protein
MNMKQSRAECATAMATEKKGIVRFETPDGTHVATLVVGETARNNGDRGDRAELWLPGGTQYGTLKEYTLLELLYFAINRVDMPEQ